MEGLSNHNYAYQVSWGDLACCAATLGSGVTYAQRHYELSKVEPNWVGHRALALIEYMPVLGGIVAIIERIAHSFYGFSDIPWRSSPLSEGAAMEKMVKNQDKAVAEHYKKGGSPYVSEIARPRRTENSVAITHHFADAQGLRPTMEDAHFFREFNGTHRGYVAGVFDGHGGSEVSAYASKEFEKRFPDALAKSDNVHEAFERLIHEISVEVANNSRWNHMGSTAVISYVSIDDGLVYTATLGDSEANIYRKTGTFWNTLSSIPLSCVRDWTSGKDMKRLISVFGKEAVYRRLAEAGGAKGLRSKLDHGVNVARALGDVDNTGKSGWPLVIHKPKITVSQVKSGDTLILACDGLKDFLSEKEIVKIIGAQDETPVAQRLVDAALKPMNRNHNDNVTVLALKVS